MTTTLIGVAFALAALIPLATILAELHASSDAPGSEMGRLTAPLAEPREDLTDPWPTRQTPTDLAAAYTTPIWTHPLNAEMRWVQQRHGVPATPDGEHRPRHAREPETPTEIFAAIVDTHLADMAVAA